MLSLNNSKLPEISLSCNATKTRCKQYTVTPLYTQESVKTKYYTHEVMYFLLKR